MPPRPPDPYPPGWKPFLAAIVAAPDDDTPRLVFADWLDENGDPDRAEFIRLQTALDRDPDYQPDRRPWEFRFWGATADQQAAFKRQAALRNAHEPRWRAGYPGWSRRQPCRQPCRLRRGFHDWLGPVPGGMDAYNPGGIPLGRWAAGGNRIRRLTPLHGVTLALGGADPGPTLDLPPFRGLTGLALVDPPADPTALPDSPALDSLTELTIHRGGFRRQAFDGPGAVRLLAGPRLARLTSLRFGGLTLGPAVGRAFARSPHLAHLREVDLGGTDIGRENVRDWLAAHVPGGLVVLRLAGCGLDDDDVLALTRSPRAAAVEELELGGNPLTDAAADRLADWPGLATVRRLGLRSTGLTRDALRRLLESPFAARLWLLEVGGSGPLGHHDIRYLGTVRPSVAVPTP